MLYSELQCSEAIHKAVEQMGFAEMTEIQEKTIPVMLAGRDVIAKAPTGTGKTCAFGIPVAEQIDPARKVPQAVIMAPTRELAQQIADELAALTAFMPGVEVACVYGGANMEKQAKWSFIFIDHFYFCPFVKWHRKITVHRSSSTKSQLFTRS